MDDLIYLIELTDNPTEILNQLPYSQKTALKKFMAYPKNSSGRIMQDDFFQFLYLLL